MRIDPTALTAIHDTRSRDTQPGTKPADDQASVVSLGAAATQATSVNPSISTRIHRIRELLSNGDYQVDLDKLAGRILDDDVARTQQS
ncbi:MAG TPA: flagellar biosynthesis anti-sigma factor FlgM [Kofleriaceae bacterium]|nr:flagellar biosynthesis anti-sigma factor FlgM [Kofleriaceae bacterium]